MDCQIAMKSSAARRFMESDKLNVFFVVVGFLCRPMHATWDISWLDVARRRQQSKRFAQMKVINEHNGLFHIKMDIKQKPKNNEWTRQFLQRYMTYETLLLLLHTHTHTLSLPLSSRFFMLCAVLWGIYWSRWYAWDGERQYNWKCDKCRSSLAQAIISSWLYSLYKSLSTLDLFLERKVKKKRANESISCHSSAFLFCGAMVSGLNRINRQRHYHPVDWILHMAWSGGVWLVASKDVIILIFIDRLLWWATDNRVWGTFVTRICMWELCVSEWASVCVCECVAMKARHEIWMQMATIVSGLSQHRWHFRSSVTFHCSKLMSSLMLVKQLPWCIWKIMRVWCAWNKGELSQICVVCNLLLSLGLVIIYCDNS